ncbi:hypothetical protein [Sulfurimonas gotlandica]|uniref:hypothetical protein n=1 Tax=Sulfurimonas gotlandica TaxID=1176482 RepID=UPI000307D67F|nr:hypothetical protein [Sulfurimonas gotlandica]
MITVIHRDVSWTELVLEAMTKSINECLGVHEGINPDNNEKYIRELYIQTIKYLKGLKSIIIKELSTETSSHLQNTHFIELNLLRQTTYYKLNTTRP